MSQRSYLNVGAESEIRNLYPTIDAQEDVVGLDVPVEDALSVQIRDPL